MTSLSRDYVNAKPARPTTEPDMGHAWRMTFAILLALVLFVCGVSAFVDDDRTVEALFWFAGSLGVVALVAYKSGFGEMTPSDEPEPYEAHQVSPVYRPWPRERADDAKDEVA